MAWYSSGCSSEKQKFGVKGDGRLAGTGYRAPLETDALPPGSGLRLLNLPLLESKQRRSLARLLSGAPRKGCDSSSLLSASLLPLLENDLNARLKDLGALAYEESDPAVEQHFA